VETQQPEWELVGNYGDIHPIDHGGYFVFRDRTGVYPPEAELLESPENDSGTWYAYRFVLEPHTFENGILSDNPYHKDHPTWYADRLESMADTVGITADELRDLFLSNDPAERAEAYRCVEAEFGAENLDSYPLTMNRAEAEERYGQDRFKVTV
jgi:hypothetical protein